MKYFLTLITATLIVGGASSARAQDCPSTHCTTYGTVVNEVCNQMYNFFQGTRSKGSISAPLVFNGSACFCPCSCYVAGMSIETANGSQAVESLQGTEDVRTLAGLVALKFAISSDVTKAPVVRVTFDNGNTLSVSDNHAFITENGIVRPARSLQVGQAVLNAANEPVKITALATDTYSGSFYNFVTSGTAADGSDRILISGGVQNGDYKVQSFRDVLNQELELRKVIATIK